jgi:hypothetical protein
MLLRRQPLAAESADCMRSGAEPPAGIRRGTFLSTYRWKRTSFQAWNCPKTAVSYKICAKSVL